MTAQLVLLDLDGTLVDHDAASASAVGTWLTSSDWSTPAEVAGHAAAWEAIAERHFAAYRERRVSFLEQRRLRLRDFLPRVGVDPAAWSEDRLDDVFACYLAAYEDAWCAYDDAASCLRVLAGVVPLGVLSNGDQAQQEDKLRRTGLLALVDRVLTSDLLRVAKPSPLAFQRACAEWGVDVSEAVYVGDRLDVDAEAATAAGLRGVWLDRRGGSVPASGERITSLAELPALLGAA